jgi:hypothetical protein
MTDGEVASLLTQMRELVGANERLLRRVIALEVRFGKLDDSAARLVAFAEEMPWGRTH